MNYSHLLEGLQKQFTHYKILGGKALDVLNEEELNWKPDENSNSAAQIVAHLHGNMMSRWTNFLTEDGEKSWRTREEEFEGTMKKNEILEKWEEGWQCLFDALKIAEGEDPDTVILIRNQPHTITDAFLRQLAHYPYHVGQIIYIGKMLKDKAWQSLSIPRGGTAAFNQKMFGNPK